MEITQLSTSLMAAVSDLHKSLRKQMYSVNAFSMTETQTLGLLMRNDSLLPTELANLTHIKTQSMSQILNKMEEQGLIKRTPSKEDKRKVYISLTAAGRKMVEKTRYERGEWLKGALEKSLTDKEKELLAKAIPLLNKLTENK